MMPLDSTEYCNHPMAGDTLAHVFAASLDTALVARLEVSDSVAAVRADTATTAARPEPWTEGLEGVARVPHISHDSVLTSVIVVMIVALLLGARSLRQTVTRLWGDIMTIRQRANIFDDSTTGRTHIDVIMAAQFVVCMGVLLYGHFSGLGTTTGSYSIVQPLRLMCLTAAYLAFQWAAYAIVGYTFATRHITGQWLRGFNATICLTGVLLLLPTLVALTYPTLMHQAFAIAVVEYVSGRVAFIIKGFRIFYDKFESLLFFILYLCTLEIIPPIVVYFLAKILVGISS